MSSKTKTCTILLELDATLYRQSKSTEAWRSKMVGRVQLVEHEGSKPAIVFDTKASSGEKTPTNQVLSSALQADGMDYNKQLKFSKFDYKKGIFRGGVMLTLANDVETHQKGKVSTYLVCFNSLTNFNSFIDKLFEIKQQVEDARLKSVTAELKRLKIALKTEENWEAIRAEIGDVGGSEDADQENVEPDFDPTQELEERKGYVRYARNW